MDSEQSPKPETKADDFRYLRIMLEARLKSWEESLLSWEGMTHGKAFHSEVIADRKARIDELREIIRILPDVVT